MTFLGDWVWQTWSVLLQAGPWLIAGFLMAGFIHALVPVEKVTRHLGGPGIRGVLKAALIGAPLPLCSCSVIPVASAIRRHGASRGATAGFLISTPETGIDSLSLSYALFGPVMTLFRLLAALATAVTAGLAIDRFGGRTDAAPHADTKPHPPATRDGCQEPTSAPNPSLPAQAAHRIVAAVRYGYGRMFEDLAHWLVLGFILAGLVAALFPPDLLERLVGTGPWAMVLMLFIGLPMYVCATASTPVAAVLIAKGLSPGAALVFLLAGPATNAATIVVVGRDLGRKSLAFYLASIAAVAILFGLLTDRLLDAAPALATSIHSHVHAEAPATTWPFALALVLLILNGLRMQIARRLTPLHHEHPAAQPQARADCCRRD